MLGQMKTKIQPMEYRTIVTSDLGANKLGAAPQETGDEGTTSKRDDLESRIRDLSTELEMSQRNFHVELTTVRKEAYETGRKSVEDELRAALSVTSGRLAAAIEDFRLGRDRYLAQVEREVVQLALAIAERILHRQAQMDPLLLSGAVRVALGQLSDTTDVRVKVPVAEREIWAEMLRLTPNLPLRPELTVDERMGPGECTIESHLGSIDIGVRAQLAEIERGFFDLLEHREHAAAAIQAVDR
jgi:flagellar assembly protein FliH